MWLRYPWLINRSSPVTYNTPLCPLLGRRLVEETQSDQSFDHVKPLYLYYCSDSIIQIFRWQTITAPYFILKVLEGGGWGSIALREINLWPLFNFETLVCFFAEINRGSKSQSGHEYTDGWTFQHHLIYYIDSFSCPQFRFLIKYNKRLTSRTNNKIEETVIWWLDDSFVPKILTNSQYDFSLSREACPFHLTWSLY